MGRRLQGFRSVWWVVIVPPATARGGSVWGYPETLWGNRRGVNSVLATSQLTRHFFFPYPCLRSFHISQNPPQVSGLFLLLPNFSLKKKYIYFCQVLAFSSPFSGALLPKRRMKTGWFKPSYWLSSGCKWSLCTSEPWGRKCRVVIAGREQQQQHLRESLFDLVRESRRRRRPKAFACRLKFTPRKF